MDGCGQSRIRSEIQTSYWIENCGFNVLSVEMPVKFYLRNTKIRKEEYYVAENVQKQRERSLLSPHNITENDILMELRMYRSNQAVITMGNADANVAFKCNLVKSWLQLLPKEERLIVYTHIVEGLDWARTSVEIDKIWGTENGRSERTLKRKQAHAIKRIADFMNVTMEACTK